MKKNKFYILALFAAALIFSPAFTHAAVLKNSNSKSPTKTKIIIAPPIKKKTIKKKVAAKVAAKVVPPKLSAQLLISSAQELRLMPNEEITLRFGFKNTGKLPWKSRAIVLQGPDGGLFAVNSWAASTTPVKISGDVLGIGRLEFFDMTLRAPEQPGSYSFAAALVVDGQPILGGSIRVPIEVANSEREILTAEQVLPEPRIRVALGKVEGPLSIRVSTGHYQINLLDGTPIATADEGAAFVVQYEPTAHFYILIYNGTTTTSTQPFRMRADGADSRFVVTDSTDAAKWNKKIAFNEYRDTFELRWSDKITGAWMINELSMEHYLKGLIETGNSEPYELQKAVYTAARTYAYIYLPDGVRAVGRIWDVHALWDQVYKGYSAELTNPNGVRAVDETRGVLITYQHRPVVTPYYTRSDGMTRGWKEVWGGQDKSWLQPVAAKYDVGKKLWGHGVGMSTQDAKARIKKDGWTFDQVLTYYYTGVQLQKVYE